MASFENHIDQAKDNLSFLRETNQSNPDKWNWQIIVCFYAAVHIVNAHLAKVANLHYRTHEDVKNALSAPFSPARVPIDIYLAYTKLEGLSRRARYLCHHDPSNKAISGHFTKEKHLAKAIYNLDVLLAYFQAKYSLDLEKLEIRCNGLSKYPPLKIINITSILVPKLTNS